MEACQQITRKSASNLALAFVLLPKDRRDAMAALYAFCREVDDVADEESTPVERRRELLAGWRQDIQKACQQGQPKFIVNQELMPVIARHHLPFELFDELIRGVEMDLDIKRYQTLDDLELYCYRVASVVGLLSIEVFGCQHPASKEYALYLGKALQLTNILRDVRVDAERGRIYLPLDMLAQHKVSPEDILANRNSENFRALAAGIGSKAREFYQRAKSVLPETDRRALCAAELMASVYWRLLLKIENSQYNVLAPRLVRLSKPRKISLILWAFCRQTLGFRQSDYGA